MFSDAAAEGVSERAGGTGRSDLHHGTTRTSILRQLSHQYTRTQSARSTAGTGLRHGRRVGLTHQHWQYGQRRGVAQRGRGGTDMASPGSGTPR